MPESRNDHNAAVIAEFRASEGFVGGDRPGRPILLLTCPGRVSGVERTTPVLYLFHDSRYFVFATHGGSPKHPDWYLNMVAAGWARIEVPGAVFRAAPVVLSGVERGRMFALQADRFPQFNEYQARTDRVIPVVELEPIEEASE